MLNQNMDEVVLVKGWKKGANWSFPRGKINKDEPDLDCAVREVYEETGYDIKAAGLVGSEEEMKYIEITMREQQMRLYIFRGVPMDTYFEPRTRKEISKIKWYKLSDLPTIRKKKQQQEGKGEDLAVNANKFYMVAPFLVPLKKWITAQRKLDKSKPLKGPGTTSSVPVEEPTAAEHKEAEESMKLHPSKEDLERLLDSLRQSAQPSKVSDLPEVSATSIEAKDMTMQLKSVLGVPSAPPSNSVELAAADKPPKSSLAEQQKSSDLLSLLRSRPATLSETMPQTPIKQMIMPQGPPMSPAHPHHQPPPSFSTLPSPPTFLFANGEDRNFMAQTSTSEQHSAMLRAPAKHEPLPPQVRPIPPPQQPAQLVPRSAHPQHHKPAPGANKIQQTLAPYHRTGDPQFAHYSQISKNNPPSIPPANKLPRPKLTVQSSALLNLFKSGLPAKTPTAGNHDNVSVTVRGQAVTANPSATTSSRLNPHSGSSETTNAVIQEQSEQTQIVATKFKPPPVEANKPSIEVNEAVSPHSEHHDKPLSLFPRPSVSTAKSITPAAASLQLSSGPVELSALPMTPGHSREPSAVDEIPKDQTLAPIEPFRLQQRSRQDSARIHNPPVSATINGPLNVPQFDMLAKASKEAKHAVQSNDYHKEKSPVTILARPSSSHKHPPAPSRSTEAQKVTLAKQTKAATPKIQTFVPAIRDFPPAPSLKGQEATPQPFHPHILRRPAHTEDVNELPPMQPSPSPKHSLLANHRTAQPVDHKNSLLSLFTKPSPVISAPSAAPVGAISEGPTPKNQAPSTFPPAISPSSRNSVRALIGEGVKIEDTVGDETPTTKTTPIDRSFLLGYLERVAKGGR